MTRKFPPLEFGTNGLETQAKWEDYEKVGETIIEWADGTRPWPTTIAELTTALGGRVTFPANVTNLIVLQGNDSTFVLRLPARGQVTESNELAKQGTYAIPRVVGFLATEKDETNTAIGPKDGRSKQERLFHARVADYTMRQCR